MGDRAIAKWCFRRGGEMVSGEYRAWGLVIDPLSLMPVIAIFYVLISSY